MRIVLINPSNIQFIENCATVLIFSGRLRLALQMCQKGLCSTEQIVPLVLSAIARSTTAPIAGMIERFDKIGARTNHIAAINERGSVLAEMKQYESALASFEKALQITTAVSRSVAQSGQCTTRFETI